MKAAPDDILNAGCEERSRKEDGDRMEAINRWIEPKKALPVTRQPFSNALLKAMIIPLVVEQVLQMVVGLADTMMVSYAGAAIYRSLGQTKITMWVSLLANLINVAGNAIGIFVLKAGAAGVAWPTTISWYIAAAVMTWLCTGSRRAEQLRVRGRHVFRLNVPMARRILGIAIPNSVENTLFQAAKVVLGMLVATFGTSQIAANTTGQTFWSLAACMGTSMGTVFITVIGQCMGAGDREAADWYMRKLTRLSLLLAILWNVVVMALTPLLLPLYDLTAETKRLILIIVAIHNLFSALVQPFSGPLSSGLRAAGDVKFTMWASIFATVVCRTLLSFLLAKWLGMGVIGIALAMVLDWCIKAALDLVRFRSGKWAENSVI